MNAPIFASALGAALSLVGGAALPAQSPERRAPTPTSIMRTAHALAWQDGVLRGGGADYKVAFEGGGMTYTPALGRRAPHNYPLRITLAEIRRGESLIYDARRVGDAAPRLDDRAAVYVRGADVAERFAVRPDGVELSYAFDRPLPGDGDLVVRLRVDTELHAREPGADGALRFTAEGLGGVRVGTVTGIDARDRRVSGALRHDGRHLELSLPAAFVDAAAYPLVLDPVFGTEIVIGTGGWDDARPDGAWDASSKHYLVAWQREFSATDVDIRGQLVDAVANPVGSMLFVTSPLTGVAVQPSVGNINGVNGFVVSWQQGSSVFGPWDIMAACVQGYDGSVSPAAAVAATSANELDPDAASEHLEIAGDQTLIVYTEAGQGIRVARVSCPVSGAAPVVTATANVSDHPADETPAISKGGSSRGQYLVAWRRRGGGIFAAYVTRGATVVATDHRVVDTFGDPEAPDVDGKYPDFLVGFQRDEVAYTQGNHDIGAQKVQWDSISQTLVNVGAVLDIADTPGQDEREPAVARYPGVYGVAWSEAQAGFLSYQVALRTIDEKTCASCGTETVFGTGGRPFDGAPRIIANVASGGWTDHRSLVVFMSASSTPPFLSEARLQRFDAFAGGAITNLGGACGNGGLARTNGPFAIGNRTFEFTLVNADPTATQAFFVIGNGASIPCGTCQVLPPVFGFPVPVSGGDASFPLPVPCNPTLIGASFDLQWWVAGTAQSPCSLLPTFALSDRLQATIGM